MKCGDEELERRIKKASRTLDVIREKEIEHYEKFARYCRVRENLERFLEEAKEEMGERKAKRCCVWREVETTEEGWSCFYYICQAKEETWAKHLRKEALFRYFCCPCKLSPSEATTRAVFLRIAYGREMKGFETCYL